MGGIRICSRPMENAISNISLHALIWAWPQLSRLLGWSGLVVYRAVARAKRAAPVEEEMRVVVCRKSCR